MIAIPALPRAPAVPRRRAAPIAGALLLAVVGGLSTPERLLPPAPLVRATIALDGAGGADAVVGDWALGHVAVGDSLDGAVRLLDDRDGRLLGAITVGAAFASQALAVDTRYHRLYVADQAADGSGSRLWTLDARTGAPLHVARLSGVVASIGVVEGAGRAIVTDEENNRVAILDARTGRVLRAVRAGLAPLAVAVDERRARAYVVDGGAYIAGHPAGSGAVNLLDTRTGRVLRTVSVGAEPSAIAVEDQAGLVLVANRGEGTVSVLDARDGALRGTVRVGGQPAGVVVDEQRGRAFVIDALDDTVRVLDLRHQTTTRTVRVGGRPHAIAIDSARGLVLVAADGPLDGGGRPLGPGVVDLLDAGSGAMVRAVVVGVAPRAIAVDSRRGRAIIVNSGGVTRAPVGWATVWASRLRRWLPWLPRSPPTTTDCAPASVTILDLQAAR